MKVHDVKRDDFYFFPHMFHFVINRSFIKYTMGASNPVDRIRI